MSGGPRSNSGPATSISGLPVPAVAAAAKLLAVNAGGTAWEAIDGTAISGQVIPSVAGGRLTLSSTDPAADGLSAKNTLYYLPYSGDQVALYDGSAWGYHTIPSAGVSKNDTGLTTNTVYDVFLFDSSGTLTLEFVAWSTTTARATAITRLNGAYVKSGATTRRYIGSFYWTGTLNDYEAKRQVFNVKNQLKRRMYVPSYTDSHTYSSATRRQMDADTGKQLEFILGVDQEVTAFALAYAEGNTGNALAVMGIGLDGAANNQAIGGTSQVVSAQSIALSCAYQGSPGIGHHTLVWSQQGDGTNLVKWRDYVSAAFGYGNSPGIFGWVWS